MPGCDDHCKLVLEAQQGEKKSLELLTTLAEERLRTYVYRLTLEEAATSDIVQESILQMIKLLEELKRADRFWPWLYGIALNRTRSYRRAEERLERISKKYVTSQTDTEDSLTELINQEVKELVTKAMNSLQTRHRAVLTMRCYEEMSFDEIAESLGCSQMAARMLFFRAKRSLTKKLGRHGFRGTALATALVIFGKMTAPNAASAAQISVVPATLKVGLSAATAAILTSQTTVVLTCVTGVIIGGATVASHLVEETQAPVHDHSPTSILTEVDSEDSHEYWYYYPEGKDGPVLIRNANENKSSVPSCRWVQNEQGNFHVNTKTNTVEIVNCRAWRKDMSVWNLPTDNAKFTKFLSEAEGRTISNEHVPIAEGGWLVVTCSGQPCQATYHHNVTEERYFRYNWPKGVKTVDRRDLMHKRGWTYFKIAGSIQGNIVTGRGRIPFVYQAREKFYPWIILQSPKGRITEVGSGGLFKGLLKPWMGLHTVDIIRRDAAEKELDFQTEPIEQGDKTLITVTSEEEQIIYTVNMQDDLIERVEFKGSSEGYLDFFYLQQIDNVGSEFASPGKNEFGPLGVSRKGFFGLPEAMGLIDSNYK